MMRSLSTKRFFRLASSVVATSIAALGANADVSEIVLSVEAANASGSGSVTFVLSSGSWNPANNTYTFRQLSPVAIVDNSGAVIATLRSADVFLKKCSEIDVNFSVDAGASLTSFVVRSPLMSFATISGAVSQAKANARFDIADLNNDGAALNGLGSAGTGAFHAGFNGEYGNGSEFSHLVSMIECGAGGSGYGQQADPMSGYRAMNADVDDMSVTCAFSLTPGDRCTATTRFDVNPDPANCPEDSDGDGTPDWLESNDPIGLNDLTTLLAHFGMQSGATAEQGDYDGDGDVDLSDLLLLLSNFGTPA